MKIEDNWVFKDSVTGITFRVMEGKELDRLHLEGNFGKVNNRDLFFTKDGEFDGTGSSLPDDRKRLKTE